MRAMEPPVVGRSWVSKLSFTSMGAQKRGGGSRPAANNASRSSARERAFGFTPVVALTVDSSYASIRSRYAWTTNLQVVRPLTIASWMSAMVASTTSMGPGGGSQASETKVIAARTRRAPVECMVISLSGCFPDRKPHQDRVWRHGCRTLPTRDLCALPSNGRSRGRRPERGRELFESRGGCSTCHTVGGFGTDLGPDLSAVGTRRGAGYLYESLIDPGASMNWPPSS